MILAQGRASFAGRESYALPLLPARTLYFMQGVPLLQEAILATLAIPSLRPLTSYSPGHLAEPLSTHLTVLLFHVLAFPFPLPYLCFCYFSHDTCPTTLRLHMFKVQFTPKLPHKTGPFNGVSWSEPSSGLSIQLQVCWSCLYSWIWVFYAAVVLFDMSPWFYAMVAPAPASPRVTLCSVIGIQSIHPGTHHLPSTSSVSGLGLGWILARVHALPCPEPEVMKSQLHLCSWAQEVLVRCDAGPS